MKSIRDLGASGNVIILLILICVFSRDGTSMGEQVSCALYLQRIEIPRNCFKCCKTNFQTQIDRARNHYHQLLFVYIKATRSESSRLNASLHKAMKTVKDVAEYTRSHVLWQTNNEILNKSLNNYRNWIKDLKDSFACQRMSSVNGCEVEFVLL